MCTKEVLEAKQKDKLAISPYYGDHQDENYYLRRDRRQGGRLVK